jgi:hypothetical protein
VDEFFINRVRPDGSTVNAPFANAFIFASFLDDKQVVTEPGDKVDSAFYGTCLSWTAGGFTRLVVRCNNNIAPNTDITSANVQRGAFKKTTGVIIEPFAPDATSGFNRLTIAPIKPPQVMNDWIQGNLFVSVQTTDFPDGELRSQLARVRERGTHYYNFFLTRDEVIGHGTPHAVATTAGACGAGLRAVPGTPDLFDFIIVCLHNIPNSPGATDAVIGRSSDDLVALTFPSALNPMEARFQINGAKAQAIIRGDWFVQVNSAVGSIRGTIDDSVVGVQWPTVGQP